MLHGWELKAENNTMVGNCCTYTY